MEPYAGEVYFMFMRDTDLWLRLQKESDVVEN